MKRNLTSTKALGLLACAVLLAALVPAGARWGAAGAPAGAGPPGPFAASAALFDPKRATDGEGAETKVADLVLHLRTGFESLKLEAFLDGATGDVIYRGAYVRGIQTHDVVLVADAPTIAIVGFFSYQVPGVTNIQSPGGPLEVVTAGVPAHLAGKVRSLAGGGELFQFVANAPGPVAARFAADVDAPSPIVVTVTVGILSAIVCAISSSVDDCMRQAQELCGANGVKKVTTTIRLSFPWICTKECTIECNAEDCPEPAAPPPGADGVARSLADPVQASAGEKRFGYVQNFLGG